MSSRNLHIALFFLALLWPAASSSSMQEAPAARLSEYPMSVNAMLDEIDRLRTTMDSLRQELAQSRLDANAARRELQELQQYIADHEQYGADFERYQGVKAAAEREAKRKRAEAARQEAEAQRAQQAEQQQAAQAERARTQDELRRTQEYRQAGFTPLGLDVYLGSTSYHYRTHDGFDARYDWNGLTGGYMRVYPASRIEFSSMIIAGSIMNAGESPRNVGVAVTFFDETGAQVGGEIIRVTDARPGVPYPFTETIPMALDRPFSSATTYVVYAE